MCGRYNFSVEELQEIREIIKEVNEKLKDKKIKTGEIYPTNFVPVLLPGKERPEASAMTWGFPHFGNSGVIINARTETVTEKKMFRDSIVSRRCVIPSTGFFEWARDGKEKTKYLFNLPGSGILYMAGCWNTFREKDGTEQQRFVILTTEANDSMKKDVSDLPLSLFPTDPSRGENSQQHAGGYAP